MRKRPSAHTSNTLGFALFIGSLIGLLIIVALGIKFYLLISQSTFDGKHQYVLEVQEPSQERFVIFNPDNQSVRMVLVKGKISGNPALSLGIPVDGVFRSPTDISSVSSLTGTLLFGGSEDKKTITSLDALNLFVFVHTTDIGKVPSETIRTSEDSTSQNTALSKVLVDSTLYNEGKTIAVVNGTSISGLANRVSRLITDIGGDVISVTTSVNTVPTSSVGYTGQQTYTAKRLAHILHLPLVQLPGQSISDITVTLGTDKANMFQ